jgi:hypothetical protein
MKPTTQDLGVQVRIADLWSWGAHIIGEVFGYSVRLANGGIRVGSVTTRMRIMR